MERFQRRESYSMPILNRVPMLKRIGFGMGHVLNDMCAAMWFTYLLIFFHKVLGFENVLAGALLALGQLADGISTVFVGIFSDRSLNYWMCNIYGNRKSCISWEHFVYYLDFSLFSLPVYNAKIHRNKKKWYTTGDLY